MSLKDKSLVWSQVDRDNLYYPEKDVREAVRNLKDKILDYANEELGGEIEEVPELRKVWLLIEEVFGKEEEKQ